MNSRTSNPIFIIGTERSGSNLLRFLLNANPQIAIPHPPHVMRDIAPFAHLYGDLQRDENFKTLVRDVARIVNMHFAPWPFAIREKELFKFAHSRSLYGVYAGLYEQYLKHADKSRWGCKSTFMYRHIGDILRHHESPRFLHLVRDPRDVAASAGESIFSRFHPYKEAQLWAEQQNEIEKWAHLAQEGKLLRVRYEDLVSQPEAELKKIMAFLGEQYRPEQMLYFRGPEAGALSRLSESWKNCAAPVSNKSVGRFRAELSQREIAHVEFHAHKLMRKYGYALASRKVIQKPDLWELAKIESSDRLQKISAEAKSLLKDKNFYQRWKKWAFIQTVKKSKEWQRKEQWNRH